jgi:hypothetical protein
MRVAFIIHVLGKCPCVERAPWPAAGDLAVGVVKKNNVPIL